jgi:NAD-dependent dihydropyrimidine dehydrogenase PreA subunit
MKQLYLRNVTTLELSSAACTGCGNCLEVCPHNVFRIESAAGRKAEIRDRDACMECGACARNCPTGAVTVRAGVGCAWAILRGMLTGKEATCGCGQPSGTNSSCCGG